MSSKIQKSSTTATGETQADKKQFRGASVNPVILTGLTDAPRSFAPPVQVSTSRPFGS
jgi:hypothetical protein